MPVDGLPTSEDWTLWSSAAASVAASLASERGVHEWVSLRGTPAALWVEVGDLSLRVTGPGPDLSSPEDLFDRVDRWVAFERPQGPGRLLDRDRGVIESWDQILLAGRTVWEEACTLVFADLKRARAASIEWTLELRDEDEVWPVQRRDDDSDTFTRRVWSRSLRQGSRCRTAGICASASCG